MVPKHHPKPWIVMLRFRAVLFRMVPKQAWFNRQEALGFRAVLFRMVPKQNV